MGASGRYHVLHPRPGAIAQVARHNAELPLWERRCQLNHRCLQVGVAQRHQHHVDALRMDA